MAAEKLKEEANAAFQACKFTNAVELYTQAIDIDDKNAVYWANRAFAHTKLEEYGSAIQDATRAIELDPKYVKAYYRRGAAYLAIGKFKEGLKDFHQVCKIVPKDPDARNKLKECEKAVRRIRFEEAITVQDTSRPISETIDPERIEVQDTYDGARISEGGIDLDFVTKMVDNFRQQKLLHRKYVLQILLESRKLLYALPSLVDITVPDGCHITVCGDTHGQFYDLLHILEVGGPPSNENPYLFNGDFVDRGAFSVEVILTLLAYKCLYPAGFHLTRGNHESMQMNKMFGFQAEVKAKFYGQVPMELFWEVFSGLPLAYVINQKIFVVHGGLFSEDNVQLSDIRRINRFQEPPNKGLMHDILWADPHPGTGRIPSKRGVGVCFGSDVTQSFCELNNLDLVVRSHEVKDDGYQVQHGGKVITIFSAPNYCDVMGNKGAYVRFEAPLLQPKFTTFSAVPHPPVQQDRMGFAL